VLANRLKFARKSAMFGCDRACSPKDRLRPVLDGIQHLAYFDATCCNVSCFSSTFSLHFAVHWQQICPTQPVVGQLSGQKDALTSAREVSENRQQSRGVKWEKQSCRKAEISRLQDSESKIYSNTVHASEALFAELPGLSGRAASSGPSRKKGQPEATADTK